MSYKLLGAAPAGRLLLRSLFGLIVLLGVNEPSSAQTNQNRNSAAADANSGELAEIVVTAQFRAEQQQDIPIAITALSGSMLDARNITNITEVTSVAPNVTLTPAGAGFGSSATASIRGVGQSDFNFALEPGVGMYLDDVYYGVLFGSIFDLFDLDRVEVLRGPQGILTGANSIGGAIKLFSKKPDDQAGGYAEATYGNFNRVSIRAAGNFVIIPQQLFVRISGVSKREDGYMTRLDYTCANGGESATRLTAQSAGCAIGTEGGTDSHSVRAALRWLPTEGIEDNFILDDTQEHDEAPASKLISQGPWAGTANYITPADSYTNYSTYIGHGGTVNAFAIPPVSTVSAWGTSNNLDVRLPADMSLKSITAFRHTDGVFSQDLSDSPVDVETVYNVVSHRQFTQELRLEGATSNEFLNWTTGLFYYDARDTIGGRQDLPAGIVAGGGLAPGVALLDFNSDDVIKSTNKSAFINLVFHPLDKLSIAAGTRYTNESKDYTFGRITAGLPFSLGYPGLPFDLTSLNGATGTYSGSKVDYRLNIAYRWSPDLMTYAQYSTGFKGGGVNPRPFTASQVLSFGPEILDAYEIGLKSDLFERRLRLNLAAFYNNYKSIQLTELACPDTPCAAPFNAGDAFVKGVELETTLRPIDHFTIDASASYLNFNYTSISPNSAGVTKGMITPYTPKQKYSAGAQYELLLGDKGSLTPRVDWSYQSSMYTFPNNAPTNLVSAYGLLNARMAWRSSQDTWEATIFATNLTDKFYYLNKFDGSGAPFFVVNGQPGRPREWGVTLRRNF